MILGKHFLQDRCIEFAIAMCKNRCRWPVPFLHNLRQNPKKPLIKTSQTSFASNQGAMFLEGMEYSHPPQRYSVHRTCRCVSHTNLAAQHLGKIEATHQGKTMERHTKNPGKLHVPPF